MTHTSIKQKFCRCALALASLTVTGYASASSTPAGDKTAYDQTLDQAKQQYENAEKQCDQLSGTAEDVCKAKAEAQRTRVESNAKADYKGTDKAAYEARKDIADADFKLDKELCDNKAGNDHDVCRKEAEAKHARVVADAKVALKTHRIKNDAQEDIDKADYKADAEKCNSFSGDAKDSCIARAKAAHNQ